MNEEPVKPEAQSFPQEPSKVQYQKKVTVKPEPVISK
jgi:hypothetical protein